MKRRGLSLAEVLIALAVVSIGLLAVAEALLFTVRQGDRSARKTEALQLAHQILDLTRMYNLPVTSPINDAPAARVALNAAPFATNFPSGTQFKRNITMTRLSVDPTDYHNQLYALQVTIYWWGKGFEENLSLQAEFRSP